MVNIELWAVRNCLPYHSNFAIINKAVKSGKIMKFKEKMSGEIIEIYLNNYNVIIQNLIDVHCEFVKGRIIANLKNGDSPFRNEFNSKIDVTHIFTQFQLECVDFEPIGYNDSACLARLLTVGNNNCELAESSMPL